MSYKPLGLLTVTKYPYSELRARRSCGNYIAALSVLAFWGRRIWEWESLLMFKSDILLASAFRTLYYNEWNILRSCGILFCYEPGSSYVQSRDLKSRKSDMVSGDGSYIYLLFVSKSSKIHGYTQVIFCLPDRATFSDIKDSTQGRWHPLTRDPKKA